MSRIRAKNTGIERTVFSYLRKRNIYFRQHYDKILGKPDIALPAKKIAVFLTAISGTAIASLRGNAAFPKNTGGRKSHLTSQEIKKGTHRLGGAAGGS